MIQYNMPKFLSSKADKFHWKNENTKTKTKKQPLSKIKPLNSLRIWVDSNTWQHTHKYKKDNKFNEADK